MYRRRIDLWIASHLAPRVPNVAVAFVATIYGVGIANLFFLPFAGKMRIRIREEQLRREMMLEGVVSILEGMNPRMLEIKLAGFTDKPKEVGKERAA